MTFVLGAVDLLTLLALITDSLDVDCEEEELDTTEASA